jgi:magnesium chelatase family protein
MCQLQLAARAHHRALQLSRTIADFGGSEAITHAHLAEALQYCPKLELM